MLFPFLCLLLLSAEFSVIAGCRCTDPKPPHRGDQFRGEKADGNMGHADLVKNSLSSVLSLISSTLSAANDQAAPTRRDASEGKLPPHLQEKLNEVNRYAELLQKASP